MMMPRGKIVLHTTEGEVRLNLPRAELLTFTDVMEGRMQERDYGDRPCESWKEEEIPRLFRSARANWKQIVRSHDLFVRAVAQDAPNETLEILAEEILVASADTANYLAMMNFLITETIGPAPEPGQARSFETDPASPDGDFTAWMIVNPEEVPQEVKDSLTRIFGSEPIPPNVEFLGTPRTQDNLFRGRLLFNQDRPHLDEKGRIRCPHCNKATLEQIDSSERRAEGPNHISTIWLCPACEERFDVREDYAVIRNTRLRETRYDEAERDRERKTDFGGHSTKGKYMQERINSMLFDKIAMALTRQDQGFAELSERIAKLTTPIEVEISFEKRSDGRKRVFRQDKDGQFLEWLTWAVDPKTNKAYYAFRPNEATAHTFGSDEEIRTAMHIWFKMGQK